MKRHQNTVYWVDINFTLKKGLKFYQTRSNAVILHETLPAYCIPKVVRMETGEAINEKVYASPQLPPKISLKHDWIKDLGSEVARQPEGEVARQAKSSQSSQPNPNPDHDGTVKPVVCPQGGAHTSQTRFSREHKNVILEDEENHDRTGRPVVCPQRGAPQHFVIEDDEAESELSLGSRSFLHRVNGQVRKKTKTILNGCNRRQ